MTKSKLVLITGANRGLGLGVAELLGARGYRVLVAARDAGAAQQATKELRQLVGQGEFIPEQVAVDSDVSVGSLFERLRDNELLPDILINGAGIIAEEKPGLDVLQVSPATVMQALNTNTLGAYRMSRFALPSMNERGFGRIVNVSSGMGALHDMGDGTPAYRISKTALHAVTLQFSHAATSGVKVNAVCPGWVRTEMGGPSATRSISEGAESIAWAAELENSGPSGGFFRDGQAIQF